ncbi:PilZ domain-containing protein [Polyangium fumosum]|uniref:PilZ domain-containing protein n=1 Tax=Polyangium fumosum TaxID=889272 RepID=A0A4U1JCJ3_9BACT|nr:PilZ domain-containing protein [Polyangium fumosum]TKD06243.1 PilZ domain-containing protein [Polyangium fumosum]
MSVRDHFRAHGRKRMELEATLLDQEGRARGVTIRDLGLGGAGIEVLERDISAEAGNELTPDSSVTLEVTTPSLWDPLRLNGTVAWIRRGTPGGRRTRVGIRFEHHDAATLLSLFQILS